MSFDFLNNAIYYPATLRMISQIPNVLSSEYMLNYNINQINGLVPVKYNSICMVNVNNNRNVPNCGFGTSEFVPNVNNYQMYRGGYNNNNSYTSGYYAPDSWTANFVDLKECVIFFKTQKVRDYRYGIDPNGNYKVSPAILLNGQNIISRLDVAEIMNFKFLATSGFISPANWTMISSTNSPTTFENITPVFTDEYDDYYLVTDFQIYQKNENADARTLTNARPIVYMLGTSIAGVNFRDLNINNAANPFIFRQAESLFYIALSGKSIYRYAEGMFTGGVQRQQLRSIAYADLFPTVLLGDSIHCTKYAAPLTNKPADGNPASALDLTNCPFHKNITNHVTLNVLQDIVYTNGNCKCYQIGDKQYAGFGSNEYPPSTVLAFKSINDIISYFNDWGFKATDNENQAIYGDYNSIEDGEPLPSPSGGDSGYIKPDFPLTENDNITSIPSDDSDLIDDFNPTVPTLSPINLMNNYALNFNGVKLLFNWLCNKSYIDNISELFGDKLSAIFGLLQYPFDIVQHDINHVLYQNTLTIVNVTDDIPCYALANGYNTVINGGEINYTSYFGDYRDWENCKYSVYVPHAGIIDVPPSAVINRRLTLQYCVDLLTGKATALLKTYENSNTLGAIIKTIPCQLGLSIPVQSSSYGQQAINNTLSSISMLGNLITGGIGSIASMNPLGMLGTINGAVQQGAQMAFNQRTQYSASGGISPSTGLSLPQTPYLCITRTRPAKPSNFAKINGLPSNTYKTLSAIATSGNLIKMQNVIVKSASATDNEIQQIKEYLATGIYT